MTEQFHTVRVPASSANLGPGVDALGIATTAGATIMSSVVPGLSIVSCGVQLALAVKKLGEHTAIRVQTGMMKTDAIKALGNSSMEDGGAFLNALVSFLIEATAVYFFAVVPLTRLIKRLNLLPPEKPAPPTRPCPQCLSDIPEAARRCAFCTSEV